MNHHIFSEIAMDNLEFICYITEIKTNKLLYLNKAARRLFNIDEGQYTDLLCHKVVQGRDKPCSYCDNAYLAHDRYLNINVKMPQNNNDYSVQSTLVLIDDIPARLSIGFDISQFTGKLDQLEDKLSTEQTLLSCIHAFMHSDNIDSAVHSLLAIVGKYFNAQRTSLFEIDKKTNTAAHTFEWVDNSEDTISDLKSSFKISDLAYIFNSFKERNSFTVLDREKELPKDEFVYNVLKEHDINSVMMVPVYQGDSINFFIGVDNPKQNINNFTLLQSVALFINEDFNKRKFVDQLESLSYTDTLTGIYNRNKFTERLEEINTSSLSSFGVIHVDANSLKKINETYGPEHGDSMLVNIANTLLKFIPVELYRVAGDEFIGFCFDINQEEFENIIQTIRRDYSKNPDFPFAVGGVWQNKNINIPLAIQQSGEIMLAEKQHYYKNLSDTLQYSSHSTEIILKEIRDNKYDIYLQPKVDLLTSEIVGAEALIRKFDDKGNRISPDRFVPIYENEGTIRYLDFFVLEKVCQLLHKLIKKNTATKIAVNFSRVTFMIYDLVDEIVKIVDKYEIPHEYIKIEITESIDKMDFDFFANKLSSIHKAGFDVSLDDFGAKHSNLMMLSRAEFTEVKIDKGLVDNIATSSQNRTIIRNVIKIIKELGTSTCVAEGIETNEQKEILQELGCTYGQGYHFYRPMPVDEFLITFENNQQGTKFKLEEVTTEYIENYFLPPEVASVALHSMPLGLNLWNHRRETVMCNAKVLEVFKLNSFTDYLTSFFNLSPEYQPSGKPTSEAVLEFLNEVRYSGFEKFHWMHCDLEGNDIPCEIILQKLDLKNEEGDDFVIGYTRDLRVQLEEHAKGISPEAYFYNEITTKSLLNSLATFSEEMIWHYNYKTQKFQLYGNEPEKLEISHIKIDIDNTEFFSSLIPSDCPQDIENFNEFVRCIKEALVKDFEISFINIEKEARKQKLTYQILYDDNNKPTHALGKMKRI